MDNDITSGSALLDQKRTDFLSIQIYFVIFLLLAVCVTFFFVAFIPIDGESMENTLHDKQYCLVQRRCFSVDRGDIVTINTANDGEEEHIIIKRVIAMGGDKLLFMKTQDGKHLELYVLYNGDKFFTRIDEPYIPEPMEAGANTNNNKNIIIYIPNLIDIDLSDTENNGTVRALINEFAYSVKENHIYFLGDNRNVSKDSRAVGTRNVSCVTSKLLLKL